MDRASIRKYRSAAESDPSLAEFTGPTAQAQAKEALKTWESWPDGSYWRQVSAISIPEPPNGVVLNWMKPDGEWTGYSVHWYRNENQNA